MFRKIEGGLNKESATRKREDGISEQRLLEFAMPASKTVTCDAGGGEGGPGDGGSGGGIPRKLPRRCASGLKCEKLLLSQQ